MSGTHTRAQKILEIADYLSDLNWKDIGARTAVGVAAYGGYDALMKARHRKLHRQNLEKIGFVKHPDVKNFMVHPKTGQVAPG